MLDLLAKIGIDTLYVLALINPISKVSVLSAMTTAGEGTTELKAVTARSSLVAGGILIGAMVFGDFFLRRVFQVELHALRLAGGTVLFWVGFHALRRGVFFEHDTHSRFRDLAIVPLACPMIAGPAAIAASIALRSRDGLFVPVAAVIAALLVNHIIMRLSTPIATTLSRFNILGALIRITGLIVMTIGTQMALDGIGEWMHSLP
ncbi:MAG: MarC family protein [Lentisphaeria bacterium]|jgi:multiple antibiotic resistance protein|nr:MarC family protein [Lentisphaeria bacterium]